MTDNVKGTLEEVIRIGLEVVTADIRTQAAAWDGLIKKMEKKQAALEDRITKLEARQKADSFHG